MLLIQLAAQQCLHTKVVFCDRSEPNPRLYKKQGIQNDRLSIYLYLPNGVRIVLSCAGLHNDDHDSTGDVHYLDNIQSVEITIKQIINIPFEINPCLTSCHARADYHCIHQCLKKLDEREFCSGSHTRAVREINIYEQIHMVVYHVHKQQEMKTNTLKMWIFKTLYDIAQLSFSSLTQDCN